MKKLLILLMFIFVNVAPCWGGVDLYGDADYLTVGDDADFDVGTEFAVSFWINVESNPSDYVYIFRKVQFGSEDKWMVIQMNGGLLKVRASIYNLCDTSWGSTTISNNQWYNIIVNYNGSTLKVYVNGSDDASTSCSIDAGDGTGDIQIGFNLDGEYLTGKMSDFTWWSSALTTAEIPLISSSKVKRIALQINAADLKLYLPLDDHSDGTALGSLTFKDLSGNSHDASDTDANGNSVCIPETISSYTP